MKSGALAGACADSGDEAGSRQYPNVRSTPFVDKYSIPLLSLMEESTSTGRRLTTRALGQLQRLCL